MKVIYDQLFFHREKVHCLNALCIYIEFTQYCIMSSEDADDLERH